MTDNELKAFTTIFERLGDLAERLARIESRLNIASYPAANPKLNELTPEERKKIQKGARG